MGVSDRGWQVSGTGPEPDDEQRAGLEGFARMITERFGLDTDEYRRHGSCRAERGPDGDAWTLVWTDGPTVEQVLRAIEPEGDGDGPRCRRLLSEETVALGAVRLAMAGATGGGRQGITPEAVERLWYDVPFPRPVTERVRALVHAVVYEAHDNARSNRVADGRICDLVATAGLAWFLRRTGVALTPAEFLTARYAAAHGHPAWRHRLEPMAVPTLLRAVLADRRASPELLTAALDLTAEREDGAYDSAATELAERLRRPWP
ncbi:hypothetical protein ACWFR1_35925 [Streptomyces sp. NPDC055103]